MYKNYSLLNVLPGAAIVRGDDMSSKAAKQNKGDRRRYIDIINFSKVPVFSLALLPGLKQGASGGWHQNCLFYNLYG